MFSLQRLLGKEDMFFALLQESAEQARASVQALVRLNKSPGDLQLINEFIQSRRNEKEIRTKISREVYSTFVTALEREDIENLSYALYRIPKSVEKFGERLLLAPRLVQGVDFSKQIDLLEDATETVLAMEKCLREGPKLEHVTRLNDKLQVVEGDADKAITELLRELFAGSHDPIKVILVKDLYEMLEKVIDRCRDVGNIVVQIILKNS